jgi:hypothetical protein
LSSLLLAFGGNVINLSNRQRDALGFFGACSVSIKTKKVD